MSKNTLRNVNIELDRNMTIFKEREQEKLTAMVNVWMINNRCNMWTVIASN